MMSIREKEGEMNGLKRLEDKRSKDQKTLPFVLVENKGLFFVQEQILLKKRTFKKSSLFFLKRNPLSKKALGSLPNAIFLKGRSFVECTFSHLMGMRRKVNVKSHPLGLRAQGFGSKRVCLKTLSIDFAKENQADQFGREIDPGPWGDKVRFLRFDQI